MDQLQEPAFAPQARLRLAELAQRLHGALGAQVAAPTWLAAAVDQHAAAIRDVLADREGRMRVVALAAYADGVLDTAERRGWTIESCTAPSWPLLRLFAVSALTPSAV